jgi:hypothetical protein
MRVFFQGKTWEIMGNVGSFLGKYLRKWDETDESWNWFEDI